MVRFESVGYSNACALPHRNEIWSAAMFFFLNIFFKCMCKSGKWPGNTETLTTTNNHRFFFYFHVKSQYWLNLYTSMYIHLSKSYGVRFIEFLIRTTWKRSSFGDNNVGQCWNLLTKCLNELNLHCVITIPILGE